jgi:hypothetical protein
MRTLLSLSIPAMVIAVLVSGCATLNEADFVTVQPAPTPPAVVFSYQPSTEGTPTNISIGVVSATYATEAHLGPELGQRVYGLTDELRTSLSRDIQQLLVAKGFTVAGEFPTLGQMTFPQKDKTLMVLVPTITLSLVRQAGPPQLIYWRSGVNSEGQVSDAPTSFPLKIYTKNQVFMGGLKYVERGDYVISGNVDLKLLEPLSGQTLWVKSVPINQLTQDWDYYFWRTQVTNQQGQVVRSDDHPVPGYDSREDAAITLLSDAYHATMTQLATYLSREEIMQLSADAQKLKDRWRSGGH